MNDEKEVEAKAYEFLKIAWSWRDDPESAPQQVQMLKDLILSHGKSCYERGFSERVCKSHPEGGKVHHHVFCQCDIDRLKERVAELEADGLKLQSENHRKQMQIEELESKLKEAEDELDSCKSLMTDGEKKILGLLKEAEKTLEEVATARFMAERRLANSWEKRTVEKVYQFIQEFHLQDKGKPAESNWRLAIALVKFLEDSK